MQDDVTSLILPRVRALTAYLLEPHPASVKLDQNENTLGPPEPILAEIEERVRKVALPLPDTGSAGDSRGLGENFRLAGGRHPRWQRV